MNATTDVDEKAWRTALQQRADRAVLEAEMAKLNAEIETVKHGGNEQRTTMDHASVEKHQTVEYRYQHEMMRNARRHTMLKEVSATSAELYDQSSESMETHRLTVALEVLAADGAVQREQIALRSRTAVETAEALVKEEAQRARLNEDVRLRKIKEEGQLAIDRARASIGVLFESIATGATALLSDPLKVEFIS